jgi:hypothetical protein
MDPTLLAELLATPAVAGGALVYAKRTSKPPQGVGDDNVIIGAPPPVIGSRNVIIGPTDAIGNVRIGSGTAIGHEAEADESSVARYSR